MAFDDMDRQYIEHKGVRFREPTMRDFADLKKLIDVTDDRRPFLALSEVIGWCGTPEGCVALLSLTSMGEWKEDSEKPMLAVALAGRVVQMSIPREPSEGSDGEPGAAPLSATGATSGTS